MGTAKMLKRDIKPMRDNSDVQAVRDGKVTDMRIESVLSCIHQGAWDEPDLDTLYTEIVQEFIYDDAPVLLISSACRQPHTAQGLLYLSMFALDYELVHAQSDDWPGDFDYAPKATCAVRIRYPKQDVYTAWSPGITPSTAAVGALMQLCRELSLAAYNRDETSTLQ